MNEEIKTFSEYCEDLEDLSEQAIAMYGDWEPYKDRVAKQSLRSLKADWQRVDSLIIESEKYELYKHNSEYTFMLGNFLTVDDTEDFIVVFQIELMHQPSIENHLKGIYPNLYNVDGVMAKKSKRGKGLGTFMYKYLVKQLGLNLLGDENQYFKARLLWRRLSRLDDIIVDIVDINTGTIIDTDVKLHHGEADWEFDERVWSYTTEKKDIRLILRDVL